VANDKPKKTSVEAPPQEFKEFKLRIAFRKVLTHPDDPTSIVSVTVTWITVHVQSISVQKALEGVHRHIKTFGMYVEDEKDGPRVYAGDSLLHIELAPEEEAGED